VLLRCFVRKTVRTLNFDNPVYRKTTEDQVSLEKNQYQPTRSLPSVSTSPSGICAVAASFHKAVDLILLNVGVSIDVSTLGSNCYMTCLTDSYRCLFPCNRTSNG